MVSIKKVAQMAGVGTGTVSRALNGSGYVARETKEKILAVVDTLGYKPNELAKNLLKNKSGIIGVMVPDLEHPFFARIMRYMEMELFLQDYKCLVCNTLGSMDRQGGFLEMLDRNMMDGLISCVDALPDFPGRCNKPIVTMDRDWGKDVPIVRSDHGAGAKMVAARFIERECRHVVQFFTKGKRKEPSNIRHMVLEEILKKEKIAVTNVNIEWDAMSYEYNRTMILKHIKLMEAVDGILTNDIGAISCLAVSQKKGILIPEKLKIIAYDGTEITNVVYPQLTSVVQDCEQIARACVQSVMNMIDGIEPERMETLIPVKWQEGGTT